MVRRRHFHRRRQRQFCRSAVLWSCAIAAAMLSFAGWRQAPPLKEDLSPPPVHLTNVDAPGDADVPAPRVNGDGVLNTPQVVAKLVPALASEAARAVENGDLREALRQFAHWMTSGEALHSQPFWLFCSIIGAGLMALACHAWVSHLLERRHRLRMRSAGGADDIVAVGEADSSPADE